jgi:hypothetical protein
MGDGLTHSLSHETGVGIIHWLFKSSVPLMCSAEQRGGSGGGQPVMMARLIRQGDHRAMPCAFTSQSNSPYCHHLPAAVQH